MTFIRERLEIAPERSVNTNYFRLPSRIIEFNDQAPPNRPESAILTCATGIRTLVYSSLGGEVFAARTCNSMCRQRVIGIKPNCREREG